MNDFGRVLKLAARYRMTIFGIVASSLLVALFWGGNIGGLFPVFKVVIRGKSLSQWADEEIIASNKRIVALTKANMQLTPTIASASDSERGALQAEFDLNQTTIATEQEAVRWFCKAKPYFVNYTPADPFRTVAWIVVALLVATALKNVFIVANLMLVMRLSQLVVYDMRRLFFDHTLRMDMAAFGEERTSGLVSRFNNDINVLHAGLRSLFGGAVREPLKMTACLVGAAVVEWRLLVFSLLMIPLLGFLIRALAGSLKRANRRAMEELSQLVGVITETFSGIQTIQAYTLEQVRRSQFLRTSRECVRKSMRIALYSSLTKPVTEVFGLGAVCTSLVMGAYLVLNQETHVFGIRVCDRPMDIATLLMFYAFLIGASDPARRLSDLFSSIQGGVAAASRLLPLMDKEPAVTDPANPVAVPKRHSQLVFEHVGFSYEGETQVLHDIDLKVPFGETVAIVGSNGLWQVDVV